MDLRKTDPDEKTADMANGALSPEQITVEAVASRLTNGGTLVDHSPILSLGKIVMMISGFALIHLLLAGDALWVSICLVALASVLTILRQAEQLELQRAALRNSQIDNRWLGALSEALDFPDRHVHSIAALLLAERLPHLNQCHADLFTRERRNCLYRRLTPRASRWNPELTIAILRALPAIGTEGALPYVERLARRSAFTRKGRRIGETARAVMPLLEERLAAQRAAQAAVRAAEAARAGSETASTQSERDEIAAMSAYVDAQTQELEAELRKMRSPEMRMGFLLATWFTIIPYCAIQSISQFSNGSWPAGLLFAALTLMCTQLHRLTLTDQHMLLARRLGRIDDVRCIGRLAELLDWPAEDVRDIAIAALARLLPRAKASDNVLRTSGQRASLYKMLDLSNAARHSGFLIAVLKALEQIGDASAVPHVEHLANARPTSARERKVCDAANDCLPYLMTRSELNRHSQTLLRASSATATGTDTLMRPAQAVEVTDQEQLLRPG